LQKLSYFVIVAAINFFYLWIGIEYLWKFWSGQYTPGWLVWGTKMTIPIGYIHMSFMFGFWFFISESDIDFDKLPKHLDGGDMNGLVKFVKGFISLACAAVFMKAFLFTGSFALSSFLTLIFAGIEWILWKCYIMLLIEWFCYYVIYLLIAAPIMLAMWCYTHKAGFFCLTALVFGCYCLAQFCKTLDRNNTKNWEDHLAKVKLAELEEKERQS